jgi:ATP sulfurylase
VLALADESGKLVAVLDVGETYEYDRAGGAAGIPHDRRCASRCRAAAGQKPLYLAGRVTVFERPSRRSPSWQMTRPETRAEFAERGLAPCRRVPDA